MASSRSIMLWIWTMSSIRCCGRPGIIVEEELVIRQEGLLVAESERCIMDGKDVTEEFPRQFRRR